MRVEAQAPSTARATSTEPVDLGVLMGSRRRAAAAGKAAAAAETGSASYGAAVGVEALLAARQGAGAKRARSVVVEQLPRRSVRRPRTSGEARSSGQRASALHSLQGCAGCRTAEHSSATPRGCSARHRAVESVASAASRRGWRGTAITGCLVAICAALSSAVARSEPIFDALRGVDLAARGGGCSGRRRAI